MEHVFAYKCESFPDIITQQQQQQQLAIELVYWLTNPISTHMLKNIRKLAHIT